MTGQGLTTKFPTRTCPSPICLCHLLQEWLAVNTVDFYNAVSMLYGTLAEFCTEKSCEVMSASSKYEYCEWSAEK